MEYKYPTIETIQEFRNFLWNLKCGHANLIVIEHSKMLKNMRKRVFTFSDADRTYLSSELKLLYNTKGSKLFSYSWGGLLEELESMEGFETLLETREDLQNYIRKLRSIEQSKTVKDARRIVSTFSAFDRNYLNSSLLDRLCETNVRHSWLKWACRKGYLDVIYFLLERGAELFPDRMLTTAIIYNQRDVIKFLFERGVEVEDKHACIAEISNHENMVAFLYNLYDERLYNYYKLYFRPYTI